MNDDAIPTEVDEDKTVPIPLETMVQLVHGSEFYYDPVQLQAEYDGEDYL
jgi:hypothetical protein